MEKPLTEFRSSHSHISGNYRNGYPNEVQLMDYQFKSDPSKSVKVPDQIFREAADLYFLITGRDQHLAHPSFKYESKSAAMMVLDALGLSHQLVATSMMINDIPAGQDVIWLGIARAKAVYKRMHVSSGISRKLDGVIEDLSRAIEQVAPEAKKCYDFRRIGWAQGEPVDLGIGISYSNIHT